MVRLAAISNLTIIGYAIRPYKILCGILWGMRSANSTLTFLRYCTWHTRKTVILTKTFTKHMGLDGILDIDEVFKKEFRRVPNLLLFSIPGFRNFGDFWLFSSNFATTREVGTPMRCVRCCLKLSASFEI